MEPIIISPDQIQAAYNSGMFDGLWRGILGATCIIFGIIGWPATRYVLSVLAYPFTRRSLRTPIGSPYWDKYNAPHRKPEFDFHAMSMGGRKK